MLQACENLRTTVCKIDCSRYSKDLCYLRYTLQNSLFSLSLWYIYNLSSFSGMPENDSKLYDSNKNIFIGGPNTKTHLPF